MSGKVLYTIDSDVKSRIDIHNDIVRQVLLPSFTAQLGAAEMGEGESEDDDEDEEDDELEPAGEKGVDCAGSTPTVESPAGSVRTSPIEHTAASLLAVAGHNATVGVARPALGDEPAGERGLDCAGSTPTVEGPAGSDRPSHIEHTSLTIGARTTRDHHRRSRA